jgi:predicted nucleic-acid-binding protein
MTGIDTNVLVRFLVVDDPQQNEQARAFLAERSAEDPAFISSVILAETLWILHRRLKYPLTTVIAALRDMLAIEELRIEHAGKVGRMLEGDRTPGTDIAEYLITWAGNVAGCSHTVTFDRRAAKAVPGMELLA